MYIHYRSGKILLFLALLSLTSCSNGDKTAGPSLNADNRWDWMATERKKPLPVIAPDDEDGNSQLPQPAVNLSEKDINNLRAKLEKADKEYYGIATSLDTDFSKKPATKEKTNKQALWRTMQLHLSRLINLQKNIAIAIKKIEATSNITDKIMLDHSRNLMIVITKRINHTRKYLNDFSPDK